MLKINFFVFHIIYYVEEITRIFDIFVPKKVNILVKYLVIFEDYLPKSEMTGLTGIPSL